MWQSEVAEDFLSVPLFSSSDDTEDCVLVQQKLKQAKNR